MHQTQSTRVTCCEPAHMLPTTTHVCLLGYCVLKNNGHAGCTRPKAHVLLAVSLPTCCQPETHWVACAKSYASVLFLRLRSQQQNQYVIKLAVWLAGEDDGHLVTFTQDSKSGASEMRVYNAKTMSSEPVAQVQLP